MMIMSKRSRRPFPRFDYFVLQLGGASLRKPTDRKTNHPIIIAALEECCWLWRLEVDVDVCSVIVQSAVGSASGILHS